MTTKKIHQPLLYIHQPSFEKQIGSMQQSFMISNLKMNINLTQETEMNIQYEEEDTDEPKVMKFIIEGILSTELEKRIIEENQ